MTENALKAEYLKARRHYISSDFCNLNDKQLEAAMATEGALLILAGAGSGKTTVLINRIANLIKYGKGYESEYVPYGITESDLDIFKSRSPEADAEAAVDPVDPWRILAITFTNKAAEELKNRLVSRLGEKADDIWACTFHSACVRILRKEAERLGFPSNFTIYDTNDSLSLIKRISKDLDIDEKSFPPRNILSEISRAKDAMVSAEEYKQQAYMSGDFRKQKIADIFIDYSRSSFTAGAMDFDDLIFYTVKILQEFPDARDYWQRRFRYVLIDEYQDTNHLQYLFASLIAGENGNICVVGDDDQSIYKFRGATIENILSFEEQYKNCRVIRLEQNYRSTGRILDAANSVISNNKGRKGKTLWTNNDTGSPINLYEAEDEKDEAAYVAGQIIKTFSSGTPWHDNAVLYRMNAQSNPLEYAFKRNGIPYRIIGGTRFFDRAEIKDMLAYLTVINYHSDDLRLLRIINVPTRGIGTKSVETAMAIAAQQNTSLFSVIDNADVYPELSRAALKMRAFANLIKELSAFAAENDSGAVYDAVLEKTGYLAELQKDKTVENQSRIENITELKSSILNFIKQSGDTSLSGYLADVALYTDIDNYDKDADAVVMMTMHSAKGLEFPNVFLVGMEENIFPGMKAVGEPDEMEEERRLCYVAITRAMKEIFLVCARQRMLFGRTSANRISRFVEEIPEELIEKRGVRKQRTAAAPYQQKRSPYSTLTAPSGFTRKTIPQKPEVTPTDYKVGDRIVHKAFGEGTIDKMIPMGNDYLIELNFAEKGRKKLMLRAAALYMKKA